MLPWTQPVQNPNGISLRLAAFELLMTDCPYTLQCRTTTTPA